MNENQSLRGFLAMVARDYPEELLRIRVPVRTHLDMTSLVFELEHAGRSPVVVYENVEGHTMPVVTNIAGSRKLLAACLGVAQADLPSAFRERVQKYIPCETVKEAPWQEVVIEGDQVDLSKLPIPTHFSVDAAPYVTAGQRVYVFDISNESAPVALQSKDLGAPASGMTLVGAGTFFAQATATGFISRAATFDRGAANGIYLASYFCGGLVGSAVLGQLFDQLGWPACVAGIGASLALAAALTGLLRSEHPAR